MATFRPTAGTRSHTANTTTPIKIRCVVAVQTFVANAFMLMNPFVGAASAVAAPITDQIDPSYIDPSFEADPMGISIWRGQMTTNRGTIVCV